MLGRTKFVATDNECLFIEVSRNTYAMNSNPRQTIIQLYPLWNHFIQVEVRRKLKAAPKSSKNKCAVLGKSSKNKCAVFFVGFFFFGGGGRQIYE